MGRFEKQYALFWQELGESGRMVLSTSLNDVVTSRMMSIVTVGERLYFQTDKAFRKYEQIKANPYVALCMDNVQIEGICSEIGKPSENGEFVCAYKKHFPSSYERYSMLEMERLFAVTPVFIERWRYLGGNPYIEIFDVKNKQYRLAEYMLNR